jgi:hypothetical protein
VELGIHFANFTLPGGPEALAPTLAGTAKAAEDIGCTTFTLMDHWFQMEEFATSHDPMPEGYTSLGFLAGLTERMTLGLMVTGVTYRRPGLLAKIVTTLGIGAAWYEREHKGLGVPFPPVSERFERLEETLRLVAQYADACNLFATGLDDVRHKLDVLARHCDDVGRDPAEIQKTMLGNGNPLDDVAPPPRRALSTRLSRKASGKVEVAPGRQVVGGRQHVPGLVTFGPGPRHGGRKESGTCSAPQATDPPFDRTWATTKRRVAPSPGRMRGARSTVSRTAGSTSPTSAWTGTWPTAGATVWRFAGWGGTGSRKTSRTVPCAGSRIGSPTFSMVSGCGAGTACSCSPSGFPSSTSRSSER